MLGCLAILVGVYESKNSKPPGVDLRLLALDAQRNGIVFPA